MDLKNIKKIFFIGIGGIGMSALARYFNTQGITVFGYDRTETELTKQLIQEGMQIHYEDDIRLIPPQIDLVVYTPAIPRNHCQLSYFLQNNFIVKKRSEILEIITANQYTIAVSGSHGKTTVSSMIAHILVHSGYNCKAFLGGIALNYHSNFIDSAILQQGMNAQTHGSPENMPCVFVIEADEFDRSFHRLYPNIAVITAIDTDHLDVYGTLENIQEAFVQFIQKVKNEGTAVVNEQVSIIPRIPVKTITYGRKNADVIVHNVRYENKLMLFDCQVLHPVAEQLHQWREMRSVMLPMGGSHNAENAVAAATVATLLNVTPENIRNALASFKGIKRRFQFIIHTDDFVLIDDYAHHPQEITRLLHSIKELYPYKKITVIFQPHLFSRTRDLHEEFARALSIADDVILLDIYPARELPIPGVTSQMIFDKIKSSSKTLLNKKDLLDYIKKCPQPEVLCITGAGDIDKFVEPIKAHFLNNLSKS
jgi:UDP-N-acetylmuramate--alanine ligase